MISSTEWVELRSLPRTSKLEVVMGYGKSIELFLANGTADSVIIAELSKGQQK